MANQEFFSFFRKKARNRLSTMNFSCYIDMWASPSTGNNPNSQSALDRDTHIALRFGDLHAWMRTYSAETGSVFKRHPYPANHETERKLAKERPNTKSTDHHRRSSIRAEEATPQDCTLRKDSGDDDTQRQGTELWHFGAADLQKTHRNVFRISHSPFHTTNDSTSTI